MPNITISPSTVARGNYLSVTATGFTPYTMLWARINTSIYVQTNHYSNADGNANISILIGDNVALGNATIYVYEPLGTDITQVFQSSEAAHFTVTANANGDDLSGGNDAGNTGGNNNSGGGNNNSGSGDNDDDTGVMSVIRPLIPWIIGVIALFIVVILIKNRSK